MSFGGSVAAMIVTIKNNKRARVSTFDKIKKLKKSKKSVLHFDKKTSLVELKKIREKLQIENERVFRKKVFILITSIIILLFLLN